MAISSPDSYPEKLPDLAALQDAAVTALTQDTLQSLADQHAINGEREYDTLAPNAWQNRLRLADGRILDTVRYYTADCAEVATGEKVIDILFPDDLTAQSHTTLVPPALRNFTNIYFVNAGLDQDNLPTYRMEKHRFTCLFSDVELVLMENHLEDDPDYIQEKALGLNVVSEAEAFDLVRLFTKHVDGHYQDS